MTREEMKRLLYENAEKIKEDMKALPKDLQPVLDILKELSQNSDNDKVRFYSKWVLSMVEANKVDADIRRYIKKVADML